METELFDAATIAGKTEFRNEVQQINFWAKVGRNALANPDLSIEFVKDILIAKEQRREPFVIGTNEAE